VSEGGFNLLSWLFFAALVGIAGAVVFVLVYAYWKGRPKKRRAVDGDFPRDRIALLARVAHEHGGAVVNDPVRYRFPFFRAALEGRPWAVALAPAFEESRAADEPYVVRFEAPLAGKQFVEAWPQGSSYPPLRMSSADIKLGDGMFDAMHVIRTDDAALARSILGDGLRELLSKLRAIGNGGRVRFDLFPYKLQLQKEEMLTDYGSLFEFTRQSLAALAEVKAGLSAQAGVQFFDDVPPAPEKPVCPVCGAAITAGKATCVRCRTPHHQECWTYFGACSMFACGERRFAL